MGVVAPKLQTADTYNLDAILSCVLDTAAGLIPADAYAVWLLDVATDVWHVAGSRGLSPEYSKNTAPNNHYGLTPDPICAEDVASSQSLQYRNALYEREGIRALMAVPLSIRSERRGTLVFYFRQPHKFTRSETEHGRSLAQLAGSALATAELYLEQLRAKERSDFLARASAVLAASLETNKALEAVTQLVVPYLADLCTVDILRDGELHRLAEHHIDPVKLTTLRTLHREFPPERRTNSITTGVLAEGKSRLIPEVNDSFLLSIAASEEHLEIVRRLKLQSILLVPLKIRENVTGLLWLATSESGRRLNESDRELAEELARRASVAIENSRLFSALQQSEHKFRAISDAAACAVFIFDGSRYLYANRAAERLIGYTLAEFGDTDMWQLIYPDDREAVKQRTLSQFLGERNLLRQELRALRRDGEVLWLDVTTSLIDYAGTPALIATAFDITDRKLASEQLERRELQASTLLNSIPDYIARFDRELRYVYKSSHHESVMSAPAGGYIGKTFREIGYSSQVVELWEGSLQKAFETGKSNTVEYSLPAPDGSLYHYIGVASPEINRDGVVESVMTITRDVTDQRNAAERLRRSEQQLRLIIDSMPGMVAYVDHDEVFRRVNLTLLRWFQKTAREVVGKTVLELVGSTNYERIRDQVHRALNGEMVQYEATNDYQDHPRHVLITYVPDFDEASQVRGFVALVMDVTERHNAEETLRKTEKLAAAGRLAASIAHEINNPLESITNLLFLLRQERSLSDPGRQYLTMAEQELARVSQIATQTLRFHRQSTKPALTNVEEVVDAIADLYQRRFLATDIHLEKRYGGVAAIYSLESELRQLLTNLIGNALDATPPSGRIVVRTRRATDRNGRRGVQVTVADTGHGIPSELMSHIFEPFVTTKGTTGTGLGLWVSREIVEKHQGVLRVRSRAKGAKTGTVFTVFLADLAS